MHILIHGLNFSPELVGIGKYTGDLANYLAAKGHIVRVITAPPYYPQWKILSGYSKGYSIEHIGNMKITRCPLYVPLRVTGLKRIFHLGSFAVFSFPIALRQTSFRPQIIISIAPAFVASPIALLVGKMTRSITWLHVQDFEIDAALNLGIINGSSLIKKFVFRLERMIYRRFQVVSTISNTMLKKVQEKGVLPEKTILFPNWIDTNEIYPLKGINPFREKLGLTSKDNVVLYSGSMGVKQGIDILVKVARCMQHILNLHFVICGDGPAKIGLMETARGLPNVHFLPLQSVEKLNFLLNLADIHVLPQKSDASDLVMPSKLLGILASGKPVIASCNFDSELGRIVETVGYRVPPENVMALAEAIEYLILNPSIRRALGVGGRTFVCEQFSREIVLELFEKQLLNLSKF